MQVKELQAVCLQMKSINKQIKELDDKKKDLNLELSTLKASVVEHLDKLEIKSFDFGEGKVTIVERRSVKMLDKFQFFEWLKTKGTFEDIVSVNAQTLNKIYKDEFESAQESGDIEFLDAGLPGLSEPQVFRDIRILK